MNLGLSKLFKSKEELEREEEVALKKEEDREQRRIMKKLMQKKEWNKISSQIKFKLFIRKIVKLIRKDKGFLTKKFKIFKAIDKLHYARISRMFAIKKIMARQMVE